MIIYITVIYITVIFVSRLRHRCIILAHVTWALSIPTAKTVIWVLTREWALARDTTVGPAQRGGSMAS